VVIDLFARNVVGWSMKPALSRELALDALMMAVWRRKPDGEVIVHSDQGSQYGSDDWQRFCRVNNLSPSMSRRGNCWDTRSNILQIPDRTAPCWDWFRCLCVDLSSDSGISRA